MRVSPMIAVRPAITIGIGGGNRRAAEKRGTKAIELWRFANGTRRNHASHKTAVIVKIATPFQYPWSESGGRLQLGTKSRATAPAEMPKINKLILCFDNQDAAPPTGRAVSPSLESK